jgi:hypothetical protein
MDSAESEPVKLKAATEILDRAGVRAGFDINSDITVDIRPAASVIQERLQRLATSVLGAAPVTEEDTVDAEVVEDTPEKKVDKVESE